LSSNLSCASPRRSSPATPASPTSVCKPSPFRPPVSRSNTDFFWQPQLITHLFDVFVQVASTPTTWRIGSIRSPAALEFGSLRTTYCKVCRG
jgi:hypothetical protein